MSLPIPGVANHSKGWEARFKGPMGAKSILLSALAFLVLINMACKSQPNAATAAPIEAVPATQNASATATSQSPAGPTVRANGQRAMQYVQEVVAFGPRPVGSAAHQKLESYLRTKLRADDLEEDAFPASTPNGPMPMRNFIAKFPGTRDGVIVVAGHYDTKPLNNFVGANDAGSSTALLLELASDLRGKKREGYAVWLAFLDGEESIQQSNDMDFSNSMYGSQHLAAKWQKDGTSKQLKAFVLLDMIGDADLNIERDQNSTPWLQDLVYRAATQLGYQSHFFRRNIAIEDDHIPFAKNGVPVIDLIDLDYGYNNVFWHTSQDTVDKLSPASLEIVGSVVLQTIRLIDQR